MPCSTPIRLTSSTHRQLSSEMLSMPLPPATPALLQTTWTFPKASYDALAACSTLAGSATSQITPRTFGPKLRRLLDGGRQRVRLDIGEHHLHARLRKGPAERKPDAAGAARHECRLAGKLPHDSPRQVAKHSAVIVGEHGPTHGVRPTLGALPLHAGTQVLFCPPATFSSDVPEQCCGVCLPAFTTRGWASWTPLSLAHPQPVTRVSIFQRFAAPANGPNG